MGYIQYTVPDTVAVELTFVAFLNTRKVTLPKYGTVTRLKKASEAGLMLGENFEFS